MSAKDTTTNESRSLDLKAAAAYSGLSYWYLRDAAEKGLIATVRLPDPFKPGKFLRRILFRKEALDSFLAQFESTAAQPSDWKKQKKVLRKVK